MKYKIKLESFELYKENRGINLNYDSFGFG